MSTQTDTITRAAEVTARAETYAQTLTESAQTTYSRPVFTFTYNPRAKYMRVTSDHSVHAFIDMDGNVYKPASWKAPAKHVRFNLLDDDSFAALLNAASQPQAFAGGYLYMR